MGVSATKYLGITINHNLNWNKHCDIICSKANSTLGLLRRIIGESQERILVLSVHNLSIPAQSGTLTPRGTSTRSSCFNAELQDLSLMTIPELFTSLQWSTIWVGTISNNGVCYTKPLCSIRSIKALLESVFLMTSVLWLEHPGCLIFVLTAKFNRVLMYISLPCLQLSHISLNVVN